LTVKIRVTNSKQFVLNVNYLPVCTHSVEVLCDARFEKLRVPTVSTPLGSTQMRERHISIVFDSRVVEARQKFAPILAATPHTCPAKLASLTNVLVRDLPSYANRLIQQRRKRSDPVYSSLVTASMPDLRPIESFSREYPARFPQMAPAQVFISTLERQYTGTKSAQLQQFHWLFLANTRLGWRLVNMYSQTGGSPGTDTPVAPPIESSKTIVGEAISVWLNDCHLGKVRA
jgi:hypothetical protein